VQDLAEQEKSLVTVKLWNNYKYSSNTNTVVGFQTNTLTPVFNMSYFLEQIKNRIRQQQMQF